MPTNSDPLPITPFPAAPGLIWAFDLDAAGAHPTERCEEKADGFRWLHLSLAHQGTASWINRQETLPEDVRELLLASDNHQRALVDRGVVGCVLHDFERDFEQRSTEVGAIRMALTPTMMITARLHPIRSADNVRNRLTHGRRIEEPSDALDLLVTTIAEGLSAEVRDLSGEVQRAEDAFLNDVDAPTARGLITIRRRLAQLHRMLDGMSTVFRRLEEDEELPEALLPTVEKLSQRLQSLDADVEGVQRQLRQLREEIDTQVDQRTNQNLYILSIMTALLLPATFVTGLFGMNTGGLPWAQTPHGTFLATLLACAAAGATYLLLRWMGFMRR
ncbi:transporter [Rhizorhabdus histidinilytica]|uniref:Zinc transporter n=1 Tax=Rhizorhabdus histidinilytica TaxID=439228 RepID=A0A1T5G6W9_9SPHN|nr:transporter [Rhizorhabdus histidinilytica]QEH77183.1 transporter [Sphingomonas sp. C8-2]SKC04109.1 zinc transporter [Rhizorhabdus histidinilytica]